MKKKLSNKHSWKRCNDEQIPELKMHHIYIKTLILTLILTKFSLWLKIEIHIFHLYQAALCCSAAHNIAAAAKLMVMIRNFDALIWDPN